MKLKRKYKPDYAELYPGVEISDEVMNVLTKSDRKMEYMEVDLKQDGFNYKPEQMIAEFIPACEDSYDRLCDDEDNEFPTKGLTPEEELVHKDELRRLHIALKKLKQSEFQLIYALYFMGMTEREYSKMIGKPQRTVHDWKVRIQGEIKNFLENLK